MTDIIEDLQELKGGEYHCACDSDVGFMCVNCHFDDCLKRAIEEIELLRSKLKENYEWIEKNHPPLFKEQT